MFFFLSLQYTYCLDLYGKLYIEYKIYMSKHKIIFILFELKILNELYYVSTQQLFIFVKSLLLYLTLPKDHNNNNNNNKKCIKKFIFFMIVLKSLTIFIWFIIKVKV